jgi:hypothetical protein
MKKRTLKKLALCTETLRRLDETQLGDAAGGFPMSGQYSVCPQSCGIACTVRQLSCTCQ